MSHADDGFLHSAGAFLARAVLRASDLLYGPWTLRPGLEVPVFALLLFAVAIFVTWRLRFVQVRRFRDAVRSFAPSASEGGGALSPFQAFMTALAATIGTGNIAGVATAVVSGGPGAVFWIWCYGFFATAVKFSEAVLGMRFRRLDGGRLSAGPMHYLRDGLGLRRLGWVYALVAGLAVVTTTPFTQPNSIAVVLDSQFRVPPLATGVGVAVLTWLVIVGGVRSIGRAAEKLSPAKVVLYLAGGLLVILLHADRLPATLALVFREAFSFRAAAGSAAGLGMMMGMRYGLARGMYANEAGYGTAAFVYGTARSRRPAQQGLAAVMEVFVISFLTSSISALSILVTGVWRSGLTSTAAVAEAFNHAVPLAGGWVVAFCTFLFGYTTLIGWSYYGEVCLEYIFGPAAIRPYRWVYCGLIVLGATSKVDLVWAWGDLMNGLQVFPNLLGVVGLSGVVARLLREDEAGRPAESSGGEPA
ncbi:MAG TPA: amino acid carrier protein [Vicinamibacteria bacterium]|nr:amino acid carrier protein [Vicinamibacteria bacterium]